MLLGNALKLHIDLSSPKVTSRTPKTYLPALLVDLFPRNFSHHKGKSINLECLTSHFGLYNVWKCIYIQLFQSWRNSHISLKVHCHLGSGTNLSWQPQQSIGTREWASENWCKHFFILTIVHTFYSLKQVNQRAGKYVFWVQDVVFSDGNCTCLPGATRLTTSYFCCYVFLHTCQLLRTFQSHCSESAESFRCVITY